MKPRAKYTVIFNRDEESGWWVAEVKEAKGCITQGRTIQQARERMREALQAFFDLPKPFEGGLVSSVNLTRSHREAIAAARAARNKAAHAADDASAKSRTAIRQLVKGGLSLRDAGELLGLTRQRAQQLMAD